MLRGCVGHGGDVLLDSVLLAAEGRPCGAQAVPQGLVYQAGDFLLLLANGMYRDLTCIPTSHANEFDVDRYIVPIVIQRTIAANEDA